MWYPLNAYSYFFMAIIAWTGFILNYRMLYQCFLINKNYSVNNNDIDAIIRMIAPFSTRARIESIQQYVIAMLENVTPQLRELHGLKRKIYLMGAFIVFLAAYISVFTTENNRDAYRIVWGVISFLTLLLSSLFYCSRKYVVACGHRREGIKESLNKFLNQYDGDYLKKLDGQAEKIDRDGDIIASIANSLLAVQEQLRDLNKTVDKIYNRNNRE